MSGVGRSGRGKSTLVAAVAHLAFDAAACLLYGHREEDLAAPYQHFTQSLDLDGTVVVITTELRPQLSAAAHADFADAVVDSIRIDRP